MSSPSDFLIASSRKPLVGNSSELSIRGAQGAKRPKWSSPRASAAPLLLSVRPGGLLSVVLEVSMAKKSFDDETLKWVREMPLSLVLDRLRDAGKLFWRRDADFKPEKDARTVRLFVSSPEGFAWELLVTGPKWFDTRAGKGGGGGIDLVMHLLGLDFVKSVKLLASVGAPGQRQPERQG